MDTPMAGVNWRGVPISEIIGSQSPWGAPEFPLVSPSHNHTVLYHISSNGSIGDRPPKPQISQDKWDSEHVRLPCSSKSLYPVEDTNGEPHLMKRWEMIKDALCKPIRNSRELAEAILSYNTKFKDRWKFQALHALFEEHLNEDESNYFFSVTLPEITKLALDLPKLVQAPIPLLKQHKNHSISFSQQQAASLLANAFFCTFPRRNTTKRASEYASYPHINFTTLYESEGQDDVLEKLKFICHYFRRVCTKVPGGVITVTRRSVAPRACPQWPNSSARLATVPLHVDPGGTIEDACGLIQMDFANKYLGGGVLGHGSVQEEIRFVICPELMVAMLFTEELRPNEALIIIGVERFSQYVGYGYSLRWAGDYCDDTPLDSSYRRRCAVLALDALPYSHRAAQYRAAHVMRELNKAWVGFSFYTDESSTLNYPGVATGNWGCGAFGGSPQLKSLIQLMAAAVAKRPMAYYTFGDNELKDEIVNIYNVLARYNVTVGQLYRYIVRFSATDVLRSHLHSFLQQALLDDEKARRTNGISAVAQNLSSGEKNNLDLIEHDNSPDLFSQEDDTELLNVSHTKANAKEPLNSESILTEDDDEMDEDDKILAENKMAEKEIDKSNKTSKGASKEHLMTEHTKRLFDEMERLDEESGLNLSISHTSRFFEHKEEDKSPSKTLACTNNSNSPSSSYTVVNEKQLTQTSISKLLDSASNTSSTDTHNKTTCVEKQLKQTSISKLLDSENKTSNNARNNTTGVNNETDSQANDILKSEVSPEIKRKLTKKITDYFSKKSSS